MQSQVSLITRPIVVSGPSGVGKSTILSRLLRKYPEKFGFSVSHTTRQPRGTEQDGVEYHFVTERDFQRLITENAFIEYAQFGGNYYGTSADAVRSMEASGKTCLLDIEMEGVKQIRGHPSLASISRFLFLSPPSYEALEQRLRSRGTDSEDAIVRRLDRARKELEYSREHGVHDKIIINNDLEEAWKEVEAWVFSGDPKSMVSSS